MVVVICMLVGYSGGISALYCCILNIFIDC